LLFKNAEHVLEIGKRRRWITARQGTAQLRAETLKQNSDQRLKTNNRLGFVFGGQLSSSYPAPLFAPLNNEASSQGSTPRPFPT
jgi:hypothetical protein